MLASVTYGWYKSGISSIETSGPSFADSARQLGYELGQPGQRIDSAVAQLNINLTVLGCDADIPSDYVQGSWQSYTLTIGSPPFTRVVRAATFAILARPEEVGLTPIPTDKTTEEIIDDTTEGATWIDEKASACRKRLAAQNAGLLVCVRGGLSEAGYSQLLSKRDMRQEFDEVLDSLWTRGSYNSFPTSKLIADTMKAAGLRNFSSSVHSAKRFKGFAKNYGLGLAVTRLFPDEVLS